MTQLVDQTPFNLSVWLAWQCRDVGAADGAVVPKVANRVSGQVAGTRLVEARQ